MAVFATGERTVQDYVMRALSLELLAEKCYLGSTLNMRADDDNDLTKTSR